MIYKVEVYLLQQQLDKLCSQEISETYDVKIVYHHMLPIKYEETIQLFDKACVQ